MGWVIEVKRIPKKRKQRISEGIGTEAKTEWRGLLERCLVVGDVLTGFNMH